MRSVKPSFFHQFILLSLSIIAGCTPTVQHVDPFYNVMDDFSMNRIPLINPFEANRVDSSSPWSIEFHPALWIADFPNNQGIHYAYYRVFDPQKVAVKDGVIMAYSAFVDKKAATYIQEHYYHWFVLIPGKEITKGFQTEDEFSEYIHTLGIENPDWQTPDEAFEQFRKTGCLEWISDCK